LTPPPSQSSQQPCSSQHIFQASPLLVISRAMGRSLRFRRISFFARLRLAAACVAAAWIGCRDRSLAFLPAPASSTDASNGRRTAMLLGSVLLAGQASRPAQAGFFSTDRFDGSFIDPTHLCGEACIRNINAEGGFATITGRENATANSWDIFAKYDGNNIEGQFLTGTMKGVYFNKKGDKGIRWADGVVWEKCEYKMNAAPFEIVEKMGAYINKEAIEGSQDKSSQYQMELKIKAANKLKKDQEGKPIS
ncbi:unnamed protein product, partial [Polarella glacialis]